MGILQGQDGVAQQGLDSLQQRAALFISLGVDAREAQVKSGTATAQKASRQAREGLLVGGVFMDIGPLGIRLPASAEYYRMVSGW
jgi:hypothetical protein